MNGPPAERVVCEECGRSISPRTFETVGCPFCEDDTGEDESA